MAQMVRNLPTMQETQVPSLGRADSLEKGLATHSSILACRVPWTGEPGGLYSLWGCRVKHDWVTNTFIFVCGLLWGTLVPLTILVQEIYTRTHKGDKLVYLCLRFYSKKICINNHKGELTMVWLYWFSICMATSLQEGGKRLKARRVWMMSLSPAL